MGTVPAALCALTALVKAPVFRRTLCYRNNRGGTVPNFFGLYANATKNALCRVGEADAEPTGFLLDT